MNSLSVNNYYPHQQAPRQHYQLHQQQPSFTGSVNNNPGRPNYYPQVSSSNSSTVMGSQYTRRNSLSSVGSDQVGLTSHAQGQPWSSTPYYHSNGSHNGSNSNLSYSIQHQQYQQPYPQYDNYQQQYQQHQNYYWGERCISVNSAFSKYINSTTLTNPYIPLTVTIITIFFFLYLYNKLQSAYYMIDIALLILLQQNKMCWFSLHHFTIMELKQKYARITKVNKKEGAWWTWCIIFTSEQM